MIIETSNPKRLADTVKKIRRTNKIDQVEFARKIGVSKRTISRFETGKSNINTEVLIKILQTIANLNGKSVTLSIKPTHETI